MSYEAVHWLHFPSVVPLVVQSSKRTVTCVWQHGFITYGYSRVESFVCLKLGDIMRRNLLTTGDSSCVIQIVVVLMLHVSECSRTNKTLPSTFFSGRRRTWTCVHNRVCSGMMLARYCSMVLSLMVVPGLSHLYVWNWVTLWGGIS